MKLETDRLEIIPLNYNQLKLLTEDVDQFERELNCQYCGEEMEGIILDIFKGQVEIVEKNRESYFWHTFWLFRIKNEGKFIGSACFKNSPDDKGEVEIGYGINENFRNYGYTTEAVSAMCKWAFKRPNVTRILAQTEKGNIASQKVLRKCNMKIFKETEKRYWWQLTIAQMDTIK